MIQIDNKEFIMRFIAPIALAAAVIATPAAAQDFSGARADVVAVWEEINPKLDSYADAGLAFGGSVGYDIQNGNIVLGAEAEITTATHDIADLNVARDIYAGVRAGYVLGASTLGYVKAGYTNARFSGNDWYGGNMDGFRVGAGIERKISGNFYGKLEYRFSDYDTKYTFEDGLVRHQVAVGVGTRF